MSTTRGRGSRDTALHGDRRTAARGACPHTHDQLSNDGAYDLIIAIAEGTMDDVAPIAARLRSGTRARD